MKAMVVDRDSPEYSLNWEDVPDPDCGPGEVLVEICATAVNRADLLQREGRYPPPPDAPPYLGLEMAGTVARVGERVPEWQPGDRVCALLAGGGYAEQVAVPHQLLMRLPDEWDFATAAAVPEVFYTAFVNLFMEAGLREGETVLVHGGASGVGTAAIQMAHRAGCRVLVTAGSQTKLDRCLELGADFGVNRKEQDFAAAILRHTDGADVILDIGGGEYLAPNLHLLKLKGRLVFIALLTGAQATIDLGLVQRRRLRLIGSLLRNRTLEEKSEIARAFEQRFWPLLVEGLMAPVIDTVLPVAEAEEGHAILAQNRNIGKVVLEIRS